MKASTAKPKVDQEIATTGDGRDITRPFTAGLMIANDRILSGRGGSDLKIYEQILSDPQVKAACEQRRNAVIQAKWQVDEGGERPIDKEAAEFLRQQLQGVGWDSVTDKMLYGVMYGLSVAEMIWQVQGNRLGWKEIKVRNRRRFRFDRDGKLRLITPGNPTPGEEAAAPYFWHFATGSDNDDEPYGVGLGHWLYWPVLFKRNGIKFWLIFLEKFGMPTALGKYGSGAGVEEKRKLLQATQAIQSDSGIIMPEGMTLELIEAARGGTADYKVLHDTMDETIIKVVLGQTMTTNDGSSESQANVHKSVRQDIIKSDSDLVCESFNLGPVKWLIEYNFPGAALPRVYRMLEEEDDLDKQADTDTKISALGFKPSLEYVKETYGEHWEENKKAAAPTEPQAGDPALSFAEASLDAPDQMIGQLDKTLQPAVGKWLEDIKGLVDRSESLEQVRDGLIELYPDMSIAEYADALAQALTAAHLAGRSELSNHGQ